MNRRLFLSKIRTLLAFCTFSFAGCSRSEERPYSPKKFRITSLSDLKEGPNYFPIQRVLIRKDGDDLTALSMVCTHQACLLSPTEAGFQCPCHGSRFNAEGEVLNGPAEKSLLQYEVTVDEQGGVSILR